MEFALKLCQNFRGVAGIRLEQWIKPKIEVRVHLEFE